jgi:phosphoesterase RecJ-like protein
VAFAEPAEVPHSLRHLPGQHLIVPAARVLDRPQLAVTVDVASAERLGSLRPLLSRAGTSLVVDHHATNTAFGRHHLVDASAEATVVLVERLLHLLDVPLDQDIATNLYAGLATDTVGFRHATAVTHQLAARLVAAGAHPARVLQPITDSHPFAWFAMLALTLADASLDREAAGGRGLAWVVVDSDASAGLRSEELDSVIDLLRTTAEAEVAAVLKQTGARLWQVSLRSRDLGPDAHGRDVSLDVARVAVALGGGGHRRAAGFTHVGDAASAVQALRRELAAQA